MSYHCVVCVKQVPDTNAIVRNPIKTDGTVDRAAFPRITNPYDMHALETALDIRDRYGAVITVVTMGPPQAAEALREAMYRGADRAVLISDDRAAGSDSLATSYVLSCAMRRLRPDIVLCGRRTIDGDNAQVGPQLSEKLSLTLISHVGSPVVIDDRTITARRDLDTGWEVVAADLPVVLTVTEGANTPRPPSIKRMMKLKKSLSRPEIFEIVRGEAAHADERTVVDDVASDLESRGLLIRSWSLDDIGAKPSRCGMRGSATKVHRVQSIVFAGADRERFENSDDGVAKLVNVLIKERTIG